MKQSSSARNDAQKRVFIVEDHSIFREGITRAIEKEPDLTVCGFSSSAAEGLEKIAKLRPAIAIIDITLPGRSGLELVKDLKVLCPETALVVLSMHDEMLYAARALRAGARAYVMKHEDTATVIKAIREVGAGRVFVSPRISEHILLGFPAMRKAAEVRLKR